ncbi:LutC/YkgG family protein [Olivibacter sitiensis]|uniref:LutC/YkgG family protein n=1 Tax=Olivibacter sitiensis TaxID=376470 RepID=UPI000481A9A2|nr:LUD domain-containing protein [Olivibacter sitiensis]
MNAIKEEMLAAIRKNMPKDKVAYPRLPSFEVAGKDLKRTFEESLSKAGGKLFDIANKEEALQLFAELYPDAKVVCSATAEWTGNKSLEEVSAPGELENVDVAVIRARFGVAETGMVWLTEHELIVNSLAFLAQHLVILLDPDEISENMHTAYRRVDLQRADYGVFVMGPSATADVGAVLVRGAQGPRSLSLFFTKSL